MTLFRRLVGLVNPFMVAAALQINDPDPVGWTVFYVLAAAACGLWMAHLRAATWFSAAVGTWGLLWLLALDPGIFSELSPSDLLRPMDPTHPQIEIGRETGGLFLTSVWMVLLALASRPERA